MKKTIGLLFAIMVTSFGFAKAQIDSLPVRGFCISAPDVRNLDRFIKFIEQDLVKRNINTLVLRVDYNYQYETHPELRDPDALSRKDVKRLVGACKQNHIRLIPQINSLGHQSWANQTGNLLRAYPEFDETPQVKMPEKYEWPNKDNLYCKSYCPLHPGVHKIVFDLIDELCDAFESDALHAGMDEVFYIGHDSCKRCAGHDKAELYAGEVMRIRDHLKEKSRRLWIWGDRLIDGNTTGLGAWEASENGTNGAIDIISKDVIICDWHYDRPDQTPVYFAMKGFQVISCPWKKPQSAALQIQDMNRSRKYSTVEVRDRFLGVMQTVWTDAGSFLDEYYNEKSSSMESESACFKSIFPVNE